MLARQIFLVMLGAAILSVASPCGASEAEGPKPSWFRHLGVGFDVSAAFQGTPANDGEFPATLVFGPEIFVSAFELDNHSVILGFGYRHFERTPSEGSAEISIKTRYDRMDLWAGYDFEWELLVAGARIGAALMIIGTETRYGEPTWEIDDFDGDGVNDIVFEPAEDPEVRTRSGIDPGLLAGLGLGLSLGKYMFDRPGVIELRAQSDYVRRGNRNEFTVGGLLVFWPTKIFAGEKQ